MKRPPSPRDYARALTERDDLRRQLRDAQTVLAEVRALAERYKTELGATLRTKAEIAHELEDTRRAVARQEEELRALRTEHAHKDEYMARLAKALESAQLRTAAYETHWRTVARLVGTELDGDYLDTGEAARIVADLERRGTP